MIIDYILSHKQWSIGRGISRANKSSKGIGRVLLHSLHALLTLGRSSLLINILFPIDTVEIDPDLHKRITGSHEISSVRAVSAIPSKFGALLSEFIICETVLPDIPSALPIARNVKPSALSRR